MRIGRAQGGPIVLLGIALLGMTVGYLSAVWFVPVSLGALVFYTFPLIVAALAPFVIGTRLSALQSGAFALAFLGLALALGPSLDGLDWRGVALALGAAVSIAAFYLVSGPVLKAVDTFVLTFYINAICLAGMAAAAATLGGLALPETGFGWFAFAAAAACYVFAVVAQFGAIRRGGPSRTAMILNLEPVVSIAAAVLFLAEALSALQLAGVGLVFVALVLFSKPSHRSRNI
jgi:drug/metabolite transporter (DMT)-like permease